jgi:sortase A
VSTSNSETSLELFLRILDRLVLLLGLVLLGIWLGARLHSLLSSRIALWQFSESVGQVDSTHPSTTAGDPLEAGAIDFTLWGKARANAYRMSLALKLAPPIAVLKIPKVHLIAPVFNGTDDVTLNRGVGRIAGTAMPGQDGNLGVAGHRDGFFRSLKDVSVGDVVEIASREEQDTYVVTTMEIVEPTNVSVLDSGPVSTLTLVTCYPFYFVGDAPKRFIVTALLTQRDPMQEARVSPSEINSIEKEK